MENHVAIAAAIIACSILVSDALEMKHISPLHVSCDRLHVMQKPQTLLEDFITIFCFSEWDIDSKRLVQEVNFIMSPCV